MCPSVFIKFGIDLLETNQLLFKGMLAARY